MTKTARHPLRRRFSGGNATGRGSFGTTCGTARPACGPAAAHDDGPDRTRRLPTPGRRPPGCTPTLRHTDRNARHTPNPKHSTRRRNARARHEPPYDPPAQTAFDAQKRTIRRPYPTPEIPYASHDRKSAACRMRSPKIAPRHPERSGLAASGPQFRTIPPDRGRAAPVRRRSCIRIARRARPAGQATVPDRRQPRMRAVRKLTVRQTSDCSPDYHRPRKPIVRKPPPRPAGGPGVVSGEKSTPARSRPRLSAPQTNGHKKNGFRSTRNPFRSIFYSCVSVSGSATRMRPQYSQMIIFLPCRMSD